MVGANLKAETLKWMEKRSAIQAEMNAIIERLCRPGEPGLSGNLVDSEGFPRADIDIPAVRAERRRLAVRTVHTAKQKPLDGEGAKGKSQLLTSHFLKFDHNEITEKINANIQVLHSSRIAPTSLSPKDSGVNLGSNDQSASVANAIASVSLHDAISRDSLISNVVDAISSIPFAMVDEIADASPAAEDGLQLGDQIVKFGNVKAGDNLLQMLAAEVQANQGHGIAILVLRQGAPINLTGTPRTWQGRGLLGGHFRII